MKRRFFLPLVLVLAACKKDPPPPSPADPEPKKSDAAVAAVPVAAKPAEVKAGAALDAVFPPDGVLGTKRTFTQEKLGYREAKFLQGTNEIAVLSIVDALNEPDTKRKFANAPDKLDGAPVMTIEKNQSAMLVKDRYKLTVTSQTLDAKGRKIWLAHFNVRALLSAS